MKKLILLLSALLMLGFYLNGQVAKEVPKWKKMRYLSEEEMKLPHDNAKLFIPTDPPEHPVRMIAEYEHMQSVLVRYPFGIPTSLIVEMSQDCGVTTLVSNQSQQNSVTNIYQAQGANMDNIDFIQAPTDSYWTRDYGPWFVIDGNGNFGVCDFPYNRPRPNDNNVPVEIASYLGIDLYGMELEGAGGNWMCTGENQASSTDLIWEENYPMSHDEIDEMVNDYLGVEQYHVLPDPLGDYIKHIDCWGKFLNVNKVLIGSVPQSDSRYDDFEYVADYFATTISDWGVPYEVHRVFTPGNYPNTPYTNSLILNEKVFVPLTGSTHDAAALEVYETAMPGYEIIGILYDGWENTDALHCRTKGITDIGLLYIDHFPILGNVQMQDEYSVIAAITPYSGSNLITDSVLLYYRVDGGFWEHQLMTPLLGNQYSADIPYQDEGAEVDYYIYVVDESGRSMNHPYIGAPDPHEFKVVQMLPGLAVSPDTLLFTNVVQATEGLQVKIYPEAGEDVIIENINLESFEPFYWFAEPNVNFPYNLAADDSLILTVYIAVPTDQTLGFVQDTMFIDCQAGDHEVLIMVDEDIISAINEARIEHSISYVYPNPFHSSASIVLNIEDETQGTLAVFDLQGRLVKTLAEGQFQKGEQRLLWDGHNMRGAECTNGIYYIVLKTDEGQVSTKVIKR